MSEFEFSEEHNVVIVRFADALYYTSITLLITGSLTLISVFFSTPINFSGILIGFAWLAMAAGFYFPVDNFRNIARTEGTDITEMMTGFGELKNGWILVSIILVLYLLIKILDLSNVL